MLTAGSAIGHCVCTTAGKICGGMVVGGLVMGVVIWLVDQVFGAEDRRESVFPDGIA